jgi:YVTN family beta-propeller protein
MHKLLVPCLVAGLLVSACGGDSGSSSSNASGPRLIANTPITGVGAGTNFGFDLGVVVGNRYYVTDRNNAAVDVFDTATSQQLAQIKGTGANVFAGNTGDNSTSGPDGINAVGNLLYVGDKDSVKVVDPALNQVIKTIPVLTITGKRADEGCVDAVHGIYMISSPDATPPFATFIDTGTQKAVAQVNFSDSDGLEQCRYDPVLDKFFVNNDGTPLNLKGELDSISGAAIRNLAVGAKVEYTSLSPSRYNEGNCVPTGLAFGPGNDIAVGCRETDTGVPLLVQIMDRTNGTILKSVPAGGGDQLEYDASTNRYYSAGSRWTASGLAATKGACGPAGSANGSPCTPVLSIIDAATRTLVAQLPTGNNAHSVAIDPVTGKAFVPVSSGSAPAGYATCDPAAPAGLLTFAIR